MEPYSQPPNSAPQPPTQNPYDFIISPEQQKRRGPLGGGSMKSRLMVVAGGALLLIIIATIIGSILSGAGSRDTNALKSLVAQQQELIRVADLGADKAFDYKTRSLAYTTKLSVTSQQQELIKYLGSKGIKLTKEELAAKKQAKIEKDLETASSNNRFDETFNATLTAELQEYAVAMKTIYDSVDSEKTKAILSSSYSSSVTLLGPAQ